MNRKNKLILAEKNGTLEQVYGDMVNELIRSRYTVSEELALLRQKDEKPDEYAEYNEYAEECKAIVKAEYEAIRGG
jgi:hypothetical protein